MWIFIFGLSQGRLSSCEPSWYYDGTAADGGGSNGPWAQHELPLLEGNSFNLMHWCYWFMNLSFPADSIDWQPLFCKSVFFFSQNLKKKTGVQVGQVFFDKRSATWRSPISWEKPCFFFWGRGQHTRKSWKHTCDAEHAKCTKSGWLDDMDVLGCWTDCLPTSAPLVATNSRVGHLSWRVEQHLIYHMPPVYYYHHWPLMSEVALHGGSIWSSVKQNTL